jgi:tRNA splicing endonuclease
MSKQNYLNILKDNVSKRIKVKEDKLVNKQEVLNEAGEWGPIGIREDREKLKKKIEKEEFINKLKEHNFNPLNSLDLIKIKEYFSLELSNKDLEIIKTEGIVNFLRNKNRI